MEPLMNAMNTDKVNRENETRMSKPPQAGGLYQRLSVLSAVWKSPHLTRESLSGTLQVEIRPSKDVAVSGNQSAGMEDRK
jgi:hypothetical protein